MKIKLLINSLLLCMVVAAAFYLPVAAEEVFTITSVVSTEAGLEVKYQQSGSSMTKLHFKIYDDTNLAFQGSVGIVPANLIIIPLPALQEKTYQIICWGSNGELQSPTQSFSLVMGDDSDNTEYETPEINNRLRAVKAPNAKVYADSSLSQEIRSLKRMDRVMVYPTENEAIVYVEGYILDTQPEVERIGKYDVVVNGDSFTGYMYASALESTAQGKEDMLREVIELAKSRLGFHGIYSQTHRWKNPYADCSFLTYWIYKEVGVVFPVTTADTEASFLLGLPQTTVWTALDDIEPEDYLDEDDVLINVGLFESPPDNLLELLQPGDLIFINHLESVYDADGNSYRKQVIESGTRYGIDHCGVYIGNHQYIHASGAGRNTITSYIQETADTIVHVARPIELAD